MFTGYLDRLKVADRVESEDAIVNVSNSVSVSR